jgi:ABC-type transport system involved in multi-copper enzyme maturation permease subunit
MNPEPGTPNAEPRTPTLEPRTPNPERRQPTLVASAIRVFDLSLAQMLWSRRSVLLGLLLGGPVVLAIALRVVATLFASGFQINGARAAGASIFGLMVWLLYIRFIVPVLGVFYGTALIADEVEDKTITYLFTRPIPRSAVLLGKYLAYLVCTVLLVLPSVMLVFFLVVPTGGSSIAEAFPSLVADLGMLALGLAAYGAVFAVVGTRIKRPLVVGLVFAFGWEPAVLLFPGYLKRLTVAYYLQALVTHEMPQDSAVSMLLQVFHEVPSVAVSLACLFAIIAVTLWSAGRAVENREYVLEQ